MSLSAPSSSSNKSSVSSNQKLELELADKKKQILELETLIQKISRGKYMWESTFDAISNPVMIISSDYKILRANRSAAKIASVEVQKMIGTTCYEILGGFSKPCNGCPLTKTLTEQKSCEAALDAFKKSQRYFEVNSYPLVTTPGDEQVVMHYRDVTEQRDLQKKLLHNEKMVAVGMLAGGVAHEINNPLGGILAFAQLAMRDLPDDHPSQNDLKEIEEAALRCKRIVQDLLDFSRQNREEVMGPVQLNEVVSKIIPLIKVQNKSSALELIYDLNPELPMIRGNFYKLQQVFLNLATNAFQAMKGKGTLTFRTLVNTDGNVCAEVQDTGPGISSEHIEKIFDPYFTTKGQGEGTGLGLSISYGIVQEHDGQIEVINNIGQGATFVVTLPTIKMGS